VHHRYDPFNPYSLSDDFVLSLYEDRSGVLWVGTMRGLSKYSWTANRFTLYTRLPDVPPDIGRLLEISGLQSLSSERVIAVHEDRTGNLWVGMFDGGLNRLDRTATTRPIPTASAVTPCVRSTRTAAAHCGWARKWGSTGLSQIARRS
jgi:hypothetical protein